MVFEVVLCISMGQLWEDFCKCVGIVYYEFCNHFDERYGGGLCILFILAMYLPLTVSGILW